MTMSAGSASIAQWCVRTCTDNNDICRLQVGVVCFNLQVEKELGEICASILSLLDEHLIPTASSGESKVFYLKMKGDYHRYLAEFKSGADRKEAAEHTLLAYKAAQVRVHKA